MTSNHFVFGKNNNPIDEKDFNMPSFNLENEYINLDSASFDCPLENYEKNNKELYFIKENDYKRLIFPCTDKINKEANSDGNLKMNSVFRLNRIPFHEKDINEIIEKMNKMKLNNKLIFNNNKIPYLEKDINNIVKINNIKEEMEQFL